MGYPSKRREDLIGFFAAAAATACILGAMAIESSVHLSVEDYGVSPDPYSAAHRGVDALSVSEARWGTVREAQADIPDFEEL